MHNNSMLIKIQPDATVRRYCSDFAVSKYLHTVVSGWIFINILVMFAKFKKVTISVIRSVCPSTRNNMAPIEWIFMKSDIWVFFKNMSKKFEFD